MTDIVFNSSAVVKRAIDAGTCPDCGKRTRMISFFQEWHGWNCTCLRCGRQWDGGEWLPLDFRRGVRADNINRAKERWRAISANLEAVR